MSVSLRTVACLGLAALSTSMLPGCASPDAVRASADETLVDSHFHIANYAMQGVALKTLIDRYMGQQVRRSAVFALPLQQKWDRFEHYADDRIPPNYYMGPRAGMYYYAFVDAMVATDYLKLSPQDRARLDPMIVGFNPMDQYAGQHVRRALLMFPGVFTGIGEFSVHKEIVSEKTSDDRVSSGLRGAPLPPDATADSRSTLYNPALKSLLDFAGEAGLIVSLHSDAYPARVTFDGRVIELSPQSPYTEGMKQLCANSPGARVYWAHTGLGRFVKPAADHLEQVSEVLEACPNWAVDISWDLVQAYIVSPEPGMPALADWARFVVRYQDRVLWGSDSVIYTQNRIDGAGGVHLGGPMAVDDYRAVAGITEPLWKAVGPEVARKVKGGNHVRLFDDARKKVRTWEAANAGQDIWNLPQ